jgi:hypothetical protein
MLSFSGARFLVVELTDFGEAEQSDHFGVIVSQSLTFMGQIITVPNSKSRNIPEVVIVRRRAGGVLGVWEGWVSWVKGVANRVSLQAT